MPISAWGRDFVFVDQGQAKYPIVISKDATQTTVFAAEELRKYLERMSGAEFEIKKGLSNEGIILVNLSLTNEIFDCPEVPELKPDGYCLLPRQEGLFLFGSNARSLLYAVYDLLERCGCQWTSPAFDFYQDDYEIVPKTDRIEVSVRSIIIEGPDLKFRKLYVEEGHSHDTENLLQMIDWMPKRRFNTLVVPLNYAGHDRVMWDNWRDVLTPELRKRGIWIEVGGHGYENFLNAKMEGGTLFEKHPEWFAVNNDGERERKPHWVFCSSNTDAFQYLVDNVLQYLKEHPEIQIYDFWPPDCAQWCQCDQCTRLGAPQERHAMLVTKVSRLVKQVRPDVKFECIAYASYVEAPTTVFLDPDILMDFCPINQCFDHQIYEVTSQRNAEYRNHLDLWRTRFEGDISIYSYYRKYAWNSLPVLLPHYMQKDLRYYRDSEINGISSYAEPGDWATYELNHYVLGELAWNCDADVDALLDRFTTDRFGGSAPLAKKAYAVLEDVARSCSSIPFQIPKDPKQYQRADEELRELMNDIGKEAETTDDEKAKRSLSRLMLAVGYLSRDVHLNHLESIKADEAMMKAKALELHQFIQRNKDAGVFLTERLSLKNLASRYGLKME